MLPNVGPGSIPAAGDNTSANRVLYHAGDWERSSEVAMGEWRAQRTVLRVVKPKKTSGRSAAKIH
jgi:hypothetical protein